MRVPALVAACGLVAVYSVPTQAQKPFLAAATAHYGLGTANAKCILCHGAKRGPSRTNLNPFGQAIQSDADMKPLLGKKVEYAYSREEIEILRKVLIRLEDQDTDGDGATNKEEIALGTYPGDAASKPDAAKLDKYRKDAEAAAAQKKK